MSNPIIMYINADCSIAVSGQDPSGNDVKIVIKEVSSFNDFIAKRALTSKGNKPVELKYTRTDRLPQYYEVKITMKTECATITLQRGLTDHCPYAQFTLNKQMLFKPLETQPESQLQLTMPGSFKIQKNTTNYQYKIYSIANASSSAHVKYKCRKVLTKTTEWSTLLELYVDAGR